jgi:hypothetical protein
MMAAWSFCDFSPHQPQSMSRAIANRCDRLIGVDEGLHDCNCARVPAEIVRIHYAAGQEQRRVVAGLRIIQRHIDWKLSPQSVWFQLRTCFPAGEMSSASAPACSSAFFGSVNSNCSNPLVTRIATLVPDNAPAIWTSTRIFLLKRAQALCH